MITISPNGRAIEFRTMQLVGALGRVSEALQERRARDSLIGAAPPSAGAEMECLSQARQAISWFDANGRQLLIEVDEALLDLADRPRDVQAVGEAIAQAERAERERDTAKSAWAFAIARAERGERENDGLRVRIGLLGAASRSYREALVEAIDRAERAEATLRETRAAAARPVDESAARIIGILVRRLELRQRVPGLDRAVRPSHEDLCLMEEGILRAARAYLARAGDQDQTTYVAAAA